MTALEDPRWCCGGIRDHDRGVTSPDKPASPNAAKSARATLPAEPALLEIEEFFTRLPAEREEVLRSPAELDDQDAALDTTPPSDR